MFRKLVASTPAYVRAYAAAGGAGVRGSSGKPNRPLQQQVPLTLHGIDGRYATALFSAAMKKDALADVEADVKAIKAAVSRDAALRAKLADPTSARDFTDKDAVKLLLGGARPQSPVIANLCSVLVENGRLHEAERIADGFLRLMAAYRAEISVTVTSAKALDPGILKRIETALAKGELSNYKAIKVQNTVKQSIEGGLIVEYGDKTIDLSVVSKLNKLERVVKESI